MKITTKQIISYCNRENMMQLKVYPKQIAQGKMSKDGARLHYTIIQQLKELAADMQEANIDWQQLRAAVAAKKGKRKENQLELFTK